MFARRIIPIGSTSVFDPATLSLTAWERAAFAGSPWSGTASAGTSGSNSATEGTNPPSVGAAVNGFNTASFDGVNDKLSLNGTLATYYSSTAYSGWALIKPAALVGANGAGSTYLNDELLGTSTNAYWTLNLKSDGSATIRHYDGGAPEATLSAGSLSVGTLALLQWRYDGTTLRFWVNSASQVSVAAGTLGDLTQAPQMGVTGYAANLYSGLIVELGLSNTDLGNTSLANVKSYINSRYALSL